MPRSIGFHHALIFQILNVYRDVKTYLAQRTEQALCCKLFCDLIRSVIKELQRFKVTFECKILE